MLATKTMIASSIEPLRHEVGDAAEQRVFAAPEQAFGGHHRQQVRRQVQRGGGAQEGERQRHALRAPAVQREAAARAAQFAVGGLGLAGLRLRHQPAALAAV